MPSDKLDLRSISQPPFLSRILRYLVERFVLPMMVPATSIHYLFVVNYAEAGIRWSAWASILVGYLTFLGFLLALRLTDELKDVGHDDRFYKDRPVQRGLISLPEIRMLLGGVIITILILNAWSSRLSQMWLVLSLLYLLLMRVEFFARRWLRPKLMLYLFTHQIFTVFLISYVIYHHGGSINSWTGAAFLLANFLVMTAIEVVRKIRPSVQENISRDTYSAYLGRGWALIFLLVIMAGLLIIVGKIFSLPSWVYGLWLLPLTAGLWYIHKDSPAASQGLMAMTLLTIVVTMFVSL